MSRVMELLGKPLSRTELFHLYTHQHYPQLSRKLHLGSSYLAPKWKYKKPKPGKVELSLLKPNKPVSASLAFPEDMAEINSVPLEFDTIGLNKRGFLRFQKGYDPPPTAIEKFLSLVRTLIPQLAKTPDTEIVEYKLSDPLIKYNLLSQAHKEFQHAVPNSMLHYIVTIRDAVKFYNTSVNVNTPFEDLQKLQDLPKNLHIQRDAIRFDPETDTLFNGVSAFPKTSTIVTGLRAKKKYKTIHADRTDTELIDQR